MSQQEFRKLRRLDLVDIIYRLQEELGEQKRENEELKCRLAERELKIERAGSIAQAALELNEVMEVAQKAADQYLVSVMGSVWKREMEARQMTADAEREAERIISEARARADEILSETAGGSQNEKEQK